MVRKSAFLEARASQGRSGQRAYSILDILEERESELRRATSTRMTKSRVSIAGDQGAGGGLADLDLDKILSEFPDETLVYLSDRMSIGMDDEKREKEYNCFKAMVCILKSMENSRQKFRSKQTERDAFLLKTMFRIYPENSATPTWLKCAITRVADDLTFSTYCEDYWEDNEDDLDQVDFDEFMVRPKMDDKARKQSIWMANQVAKADQRRGSNASLDMNVNTSMERRNSLTKEEKARNADRRKSMLAVTDIKKMNRMDSRKNSVAAQGGKNSRRGSFAAAAKAVGAMNRFKN